MYMHAYMYVLHVHVRVCMCEYIISSINIHMWQDMGPKTCSSLM